LFVFVRDEEHTGVRLPEKDARVRKTERRLRGALVSLIHEKSYPAIVVNEILERADVGRSAFYAHFSNKDALLASGIVEMLHATAPRSLPPSVGPFGKTLWFSLPVFTYVGQCRHAAEAKMGRRGRAIVHQHLRCALVEQIGDGVSAAAQALDERTAKIPPDLLTEYIVSTFIRVLNCWVESRSPLSPREADDLFLALVLPTLVAAVRGDHVGSTK